MGCANVKPTSATLRQEVPSPGPVAAHPDESSQPTIALIAHDGMKQLLKEFVKMHSDMLKSFRLTGTGTSCQLIRAAGYEPVGEIVSGPLGGDQQIGSMIVKHELSAVFFFRDPLAVHAHHADIEALGRLADCYQIYFATNYRSACALLTFMFGNLMEKKSSGRRSSVTMPDGVDDVADVVQANYTKTRKTTLQAIK